MFGVFLEQQVGGFKFALFMRRSQIGDWRGKGLRGVRQRFLGRLFLSLLNGFLVVLFFIVERSILSVVLNNLFLFYLRFRLNIFFIYI
jgi:hypothetical protein